MIEFITRYWLETLFGGLIALLGIGYRILYKRVKEQEAVKLGVQALLRDRIVNAYNHYIEKGYCPIYGRENVEAMYIQYHNLGGNGTITELKRKLDQLPTEEEEV